jgi:hypothetical protein
MLCSMQALLKLLQDQRNNPPEALFLRQLSASCLAQQTADAEYHIHWSRHLLACIGEITGAQLHLAYNPHFPFFASPFAGDGRLGAVLAWPSVPLLFTPDSYDPAAHQQVWQKLEQHRQPISHPGTIVPCIPCRSDDSDPGRDKVGPMPAGTRTLPVM